MVLQSTYFLNAFEWKVRPDKTRYYIVVCTVCWSERERERGSLIGHRYWSIHMGTHTLKCTTIAKPQKWLICVCVCVCVWISDKRSGMNMKTQTKCTATICNHFARSKDTTLESRYLRVLGFWKLWQFGLYDEKLPTLLFTIYFGEKSEKEKIRIIGMLLIIISIGSTHI